MATTAQINANRANAQHSTGPKTPEGKAAVAQNRATHGLSSNRFFLLPDEDPAEYQELFDAYQKEYRPHTPTASFLVRDLAQADWKLRRASQIEAGLLSPESDPESGKADYSLARIFQADISANQALLKLSRYESSIRRDWYRALGELRATGRENTQTVSAEARLQKAESDNRFTKMLQEEMTLPPIIVSQLRNDSNPIPPPQEPKNDSNPIPSAEPAKNDSKPMPAHLERELAAHRRRDPDFDPFMDASQMSKELRRWFEKRSREPQS